MGSFCQSFSCLYSSAFCVWLLLKNQCMCQLPGVVQSRTPPVQSGVLFCFLSVFFRLLHASVHCSRIVLASLQCLAARDVVLPVFFMSVQLCILCIAPAEK